MLQAIRKLFGTSEEPLMIKIIDPINNHTYLLPEGSVYLEFMANALMKIKSLEEELALCKLPTNTEEEMIVSLEDNDTH